MKLAIALAVLFCSACSTGGGSIEGQYAGPNGARLSLSGDRYEFCDIACSGGRVEVRPSSERAGRVTFYGVPVGAFFRKAQQSNGSGVRTWADGAETSYGFGLFGGAYIDIDPGPGLKFKRTASAPAVRASSVKNSAVEHMVSNDGSL